MSFKKILHDKVVCYTSYVHFKRETDDQDHIHPKRHEGHLRVGSGFKIESYLQLAVCSLHPAQPEFPADIYGSVGSSVSWLYVRRTKAG